ncbi:hypothetical protein Tco_0391097 [Tanacetum coccineum]
MFNIKACWGNFTFDNTYSPSVGFSGGILCVWDPKVFSKTNSTVSDYFLIVREYLKEQIRVWIKDKKEKAKRKKKDLKEELSDIDSLLDKGEGNPDVINKRDTICDENAKYYHGILNKRRSQLAIRGILADGTWIDSPSLVKYDAVFMGQWSSSKIYTIIQVLECFYHALGLHIHMNKSMLMGISVANGIVDQTANEIGCKTLKAHFSYLGLKVGGLMSRIQSWNDIINNLTTRLSKWKMKTLSIGGCLTLLKSVLGSMPIYHLSLFKAPLKVLQKIESIRSRLFKGIKHNDRKPNWVKWNNVLASKEKGGLGVSSLHALNRALLFKWVWHFYIQKFSLWTKVIRGIHGDDGKLHKIINHNHPSIWLDIVREITILKDQGLA